VAAIKQRDPSGKGRNLNKEEVYKLKREYKTKKIISHNSVEKKLNLTILWSCLDKT
jgi:hypothetical protein